MNLVELLSEIDDLQVEIKKDLTKFTTMRLRAFGDLIVVKSVDSLKKTVACLTSSGIDYTVIGLGANQLLPELSEKPYLKLDLEFDKSYLESPKNNYILPASLSLSILTSHAVKFGLKGWEVFTGVPATMGGAVFMNAGTKYGDIGDLITLVKVITKDGDEKIIKIEDDSFSYRKNNFLKPGDVVYEIEMRHFGIDKSISGKINEYLEMRRRTQPLQKYTCGCVFKNKQGVRTCRVGQCIDIIGLKGFVDHGIQISTVHANFMENIDNATYEDVIKMIEVVQKELKLHFGVSFETEVRM